MSQVEPQDLGLAILPPGWALTTLPELAGRTGAFADGDWVESKDQDPEGAVRLVQLADVGDGFFRDRSNRFLSSSKASELNCTFLAAGDVLISRLADPIGRACIFPGDARPCVTVVDVALFRGAQAGGVDHIWLKNSINAQQFRSEIDQAASGTTRKRISRKNLGSLRLPVPPLNEQRRIVAKIEALQERSKAAKDALDAIPPLLEKFRQSVLAAAFRGDLTKSWRERQPEIEPATVLLDRIRAERRRRFSEANPKKKYVEPARVDPSGLPDLPAGWCWASLPECGEVARGKSKHRPRNDPKLYGGPHPFIQTGDVAQSGGRIRSARQYYSDFGLAQSRLFPVGTVCITIAANIADSAVLEMDACFPDSVVGVVPDGSLVGSSYLELYIRTIRADLDAFAPATAQKNINLGVLNSVAVPIPPREERLEIERRVAAAFDTFSGAIAQFESGTAAVASLNQSILAKAFRGELVPQDPNDEPASVLLQRIRAEREAAGPAKTKRRRST